MIEHSVIISSAWQEKPGNNGHRGAIQTLQWPYLSGLQAFKDPADTQDVVQIVFVKAWRSIGRFENRSEYYTWLYRIAVNECLNYLKKNRYTSVSFDETKWLGGEDWLLPREEKQYLWRRVLASVDRKERSVIFLYAVEGLTMTEVAKVMGISRQMLYKKWNIIMTRLQKSMRNG